MKCKRIRDLLLTDYVDDCLSAEDRGDLERHCAACEKCRQLAEQVHKNVRAPFLSLTPEKTPADVWEAVQKNIAAEAVRQPAAAGWLVRSRTALYAIKNPVLSAGPVPVFAVIVLVAFFLAGQHHRRAVEITRAAETAAYLVETFTYADEGAVPADYETDLEDVFF